MNILQFLGSITPSFLTPYIHPIFIAMVPKIVAILAQNCPIFCPKLLLFSFKTIPTFYPNHLCT